MINCRRHYNSHRTCNLNIRLVQKELLVLPLKVNEKTAITFAPPDTYTVHPCILVHTCRHMHTHLKSSH